MDGHADPARRARPFTLPRKDQFRVTGDGHGKEETVKNMLSTVAAAVVTCGLLVTTTGAASAERTGPPRPHGQAEEHPFPGQGPPGRSHSGGAPHGTEASVADAARAVVRLVDEERTRVGCPSVRPHRDLMRAADGHSRAMAESGRLSHREPDGSDVSDRMAEAGYEYREAAENVTSGAPDAEAAVRSWMESPGHRRHIVNCSFDDMGVGVRHAPDGPWWTLLLATPR